MYPDQTVPEMMPEDDGGGSGRGGVILIVLLVLLALGLGGAAYYEFQRAKVASNILSSAQQQAKSQGAQEQKKLDDDRYQQENETPYRSYIAPDTFGAFEIKFPKDWSGYVEENLTGSPQINLLLQPDFVSVIQNQDNAYATRVQLLEQTYDALTQSRQQEVQDGKLKMTTVTVSGITSARYEGKYDQKHDGIAVVIPVRDKVIVISTEDKHYQPEYEQILKLAKINP